MFQLSSSVRYSPLVPLACPRVCTQYWSSLCLAVYLVFATFNWYKIPLVIPVSLLRQDFLSQYWIMQCRFSPGSSRQRIFLVCHPVEYSPSSSQWRHDCNLYFVQDQLPSFSWLMSTRTSKNVFYLCRFHYLVMRESLTAIILFTMIWLLCFSIYSVE